MEGGMGRGVFAQEKFPSEMLWLLVLVMVDCHGAFDAFDVFDILNCALAAKQLAHYR